MRELLHVWWRGFLIVTLTAMNTGQIAGRHWLGSGIVGFLISWTWWRNARHAAYGIHPRLGEAYATGAGMGTLFGMWLVKWLYG